MAQRIPTKTPIPGRRAGIRRSATGVHFAVMQRLADRGITASPEVAVPATSSKSRATHFRADIGVFRHNKLWLLIECKATGRELGVRERENYEGAPVPYMVAGDENIDEVVAMIDRAYESGRL